MIVTLDDGAVTNVERWGERGPVVLCVHGMTGSRRSWLRLAKRYADRMQFVAYDQRGHGESAEVPGPMALQRGVWDAVNVAAAIGNVDVLMGHSWGGAVVIGAGEELDVRGVVAIDPMLVQASDEWYAEYIEELDAQFAAAGSDRDAAVRRLYAGRHPYDLEGTLLGVRRMTTAPIAGLRDENRGGAWDLRPRIADYAKPMLLAFADREESIVPAATIDEIAAKHSPNVRVEIFEGLGHSLHRDGFERFTSALDRFFDDLSRQGSLQH